MINLDYIDIKKELIPYSFDITLEGETYTFEVDYNGLKDYFTINLLKNGEVIVLGEKIIYAKPLFLTAAYRDIPKVDIIPYALSEDAERITFENFNKDVFLYLVGD